MKIGTKVRIIPNGLKASDNLAGLAPNMLKMQDKIYPVKDVDIRQVKVDRFWFSRLDVTECLEDKPVTCADDVLFNPENLDV